jgi:hypothetical protein
LGAIFVRNCICGFAATALLCGCAIPSNPGWVRDGLVTTNNPDQQAELAVDIHICEHWSPAGGGRIDPEHFRLCMLALGWRPNAGNAMLVRQLAEK